MSFKSEVLGVIGHLSFVIGHRPEGARVSGLYVITAREMRPGRGHLDILRACVEAGVGWVQIRDKSMLDSQVRRSRAVPPVEVRAGARQLDARLRAELGSRDLANLVRQAMDLVAGTGCRVLVNDRIDVALAAKADGVHVGQEDLPVAAARALLREGMILGASAKTPEEAKEAEAAGADYLGVGAIFPSPTKPTSSVIGLEGLGRVRAATRLPIVAIGGITVENIAEVARAGADAAAVVSAVAAADDMVAAIRRLQGEFARGRGASLEGPG